LYLGSGPVTAPSSGPVLKEKTEITGNDLKQLMLDSNTSFAQDSEQDTAVITTPHVVKLKQQKPNMLRKGGFGKTLKGIRGALMSDRPERTPVYPTEGTPYSQLQDTSGGAVKSASESKNKFGGFFGSDRNGTKHLRTMQNNNSNPSLVSDVSSGPRKFTWVDITNLRLIFAIQNSSGRIYQPDVHLKAKTYLPSSSDAYKKSNFAAWMLKEFTANPEVQDKSMV
jgi:hypothetical protein